MERQELVALLQGAQGFIEKAIGGLTEEQLSAVPQGRSNNILWNLGHLAHSLAGMTYVRSGLDYPLPAGYPDMFKGGSSPTTWKEAPAVSEVVGHFKKLTPQVANDLTAGKFDAFKAFDLMPGLTMNSIDQVLGFHLMHAGMHMNAIGAIRKAVA